MSDNKDNKKKGFFSRLFGGSSSPEETNNELTTPEDSVEIPTKSALNKMKKADIVDVAKQNGLDLDISLTKAKLLEAWDLHFNQSSNPSAVDDAATAMAESAEATANIESLADEQASVEEEAPVQEIPSEEEVSAEEVPAEEEAPAEEAAPAEEEVPAEEAAPAEEEAPGEEEAPKEVKVSLDEQSPSQIINNFESKQLKSDLPEFRPGDTVVVSVKVREGDRTRLQAFEGVVMGVKKAGLNSSFIVRKISSGIGVERTFQTHSPMIDSIKVKRKGDVRQAKLFYLRERSGKSARIKERLE